MIKIGALFLLIFVILLFCWNVTSVDSIYDTNINEEEETITEYTNKIIDITTDKTINKNESNILDYYGEENDDYDYSNSDSCTIDTFIDDITGKIFPDDYEETKKLEIKFGTDSINETIDIIMRLYYYMQNVSERLQPYMKRIAPRFTELLPLINLPPNCLASLARISEAAQDGQLWALKFLDSQPAFLTSGRLQGIATPMGEYDQCLGIRGPEETDKDVIFGKYCGLRPVIPMPSKLSIGENDTIDDRLELLILEKINSTPKLRDNPQLRKYLTDDFRFKFDPEIVESVFLANDLNRKIGNKLYPMKVCLPSTCHTKDVEYAINKLIYPITRLPIELSPDCDYIGKPIVIDDYQLTALITFGVLIILVTLSTIFEICYNRFGDNSKKPSLLSQIGKTFSVVTNSKKIFTTKSEHEKFTALDGIKVVFTFWAFMTHVTLLPGFIAANVQKDLVGSVTNEVRTSWIWFTVRNFHFTDGFFMIGACLTSYIMLSKLQHSHGNFNFFQYAIFRYIRLVPTIIAGIFLIYLLPLIGDGPLWSDLLDTITLTCYRNWNSSLLMISNYNIYFPDRFTCNSPTWYLSTDFQLYLMAPIVFLSLYYWPKFGVYCNLILIILGSIVTILPKLLYGIPHFIEYRNIHSMETSIKSLRHTYYGVEVHIGSYVCGIFLGYLIKAKPNVYLGGTIGELFLWISTGLLSFWGVVWQKPHFENDYQITQTEVYLFMLFGKYCFLSFWFWLIYACTTDRAGFINKLFGWKGFKFFSNISFEFYVVHLIPITYRYSIVRDPIRQNNYYVLSIVPIDIILTSILSVVVILLFSAPFNNLVNLLIKGQIEKIQNQKKYNDNVILVRKEEQINELNDNKCVENSPNNVLKIKVNTGMAESLTGLGLEALQTRLDSHSDQTQN